MRETWPLPTGVASGPLRAILFALIDLIASSGILVLPSGPFTGVTLTSSHSIGTLAAPKTVLTALDISGPIPSPGMSETLYFPC